MMRREDPKSHIFIPPCGSQEGQDSCWLCGKSTTTSGASFYVGTFSRKTRLL